MRTLYTNHIWKEDEMVFPMVDRLFSAEERKTLFERFETAEAEIGADHEAPTTRRWLSSRWRWRRRCVIPSHRLLAVCLFSALLGACEAEALPTMEVVSNFEIERYLGHWHQVAAIPAWFTEECAARIGTTYTAGESGRIGVRNACERADGTVSEALGQARFVGPASQGRLEVTFLKLWGFWLWLAGGDYWVIGLDADYEWAVIGYPERKYGWVLARTPSLGEADLLEARAVLEREGYDTCRLRMTAPETEGRLCNVGK